MKKAKAAPKKSASKKSSSCACTSPLCKLMTSAKGRAFGKAGQVFYTEYLKIVKKTGDKKAVDAIAGAIIEMTAMSKGKICACNCGSGDDCCGSDCGCEC